MRRNGFTLLEITMVLLISSVIMAILLSVYTIFLDQMHLSTGEHLQQQALSSTLSIIEADFRSAETANIQNAHHLWLVSQGTTIDYVVNPGQSTIQLWKTKTTSTNSTSAPLCDGLVSDNTSFAVSDGAAWITLNATSLTLSSRIRLRNTDYAPQ